MQLFSRPPSTTILVAVDRLSSGSVADKRSTGTGFHRMRLGSDRHGIVTQDARFAEV